MTKRGDIPAKSKRRNGPKAPRDEASVARSSELVALLKRERDEAREQLAATGEILKVMRRSSTSAEAVFNAIVESAARLCNGVFANVRLYDGHKLHVAATYNFTPEVLDRYLKSHPKIPDRSDLAGRSILTGVPVHLPDVLADPDYDHQMALSGNWRSVLSVPMLREGKPIGMIAVSKSQPIPFSEHEINLLKTFADQAVIAIENVRLFESVQARTRELAASLEELRNTQDRLVQTEKLASLGQLTAGIAHEIKNPLNFVNNFSALSAELIDELDETLAPAPLDHKMRGDVGELTQMIRSNLEKVVQHGKRADSIVKNMLLHSREGSGEYRSAEINALVEESLNLAYHGARAEKSDFNITLQRDFDPVIGMADVYPQEITRVLLNLISNGFYATTRRATEIGEGFEPTLRATTKNLGEKIEIRIRDNGIGIASDVKEKIFNPFFTTKPAGEGTGLGLSMSHDIVVKQHGGTIDVATEPGIFTEFIITLPRTPS